jgi:hypothetical protein
MGLSFGQAHASLRTTKNVGMTKLGDATTLSSEDDWNASLISHTYQQRQLSPLPVTVHIDEANLAQPSELGFDI